MSLFGSGSLVESVTDLQLQMQGVDIKVTKADGTVIWIEEKIRARDWGDLCLETLSCVERETKGWIEKDSIADYLVYFCKDSKRFFILKMSEIQSEYNRRKPIWLDRHRIVTSNTDNLYHSRNVAVPWGDVESRVFSGSLQQN
jgi:hypothetical protein